VSTPERPSPYVAQRFHVEIDGIVVAGFTECSGLSAETEVEEIVEGGENRFHHRLPKGTKYGPLVLKRGITDSSTLWDWHRDVVMGKVERHNVAVILWDVWDPNTADERWRWTLKEAYPVKWTGPELKSDGNTVAIEAIELAHRGIDSAIVTQS
jgi:phage tail-like protein